MIGRSVARRYVQAALERAASQGLQEQLEEELKVLQMASGAAPELVLLLKHPTISAERKLSAVGAVLGAEPCGPVAELVGLLIENSRVDVLSVAGDLAEELADEVAGRTRAAVVTPLALAPEQAQRLQAALAGWLGSPVRLDARVDPDLIGGIVVKLGDRVLDASLRGRLERIGESLTAP